MKDLKTVDRPKIGLALGSGGARGLSIIGIIKVLEQNNIPIDYIAGSSMGALVGGFYAAGVSTSQMEEITLGTSWNMMFSLIDPNLKGGLISGEKITSFIKSYVNDKKIEECRIGFSAMATDLKTGKSVTLNKGEISEAIRASISAPVVFNPIIKDNQILIDGGLSSPVPVQIVREMGADIVIAVNLDSYFFNEKQDLKLYSLADKSLSLLRYHLSKLCAEDADIVINPQLHEIRWERFVGTKKAILSGEKVTQALLPEILKLMER